MKKDIRRMRVGWRGSDLDAQLGRSKGGSRAVLQVGRGVGLDSHAHLFAITTPIHTGHFKNLLETHPNQPFVDSVVRGLEEGFWPWASTVDSGRPEVVDNSGRMVREESHLTFIREQRDLEIKLGRFSPSFTSLLPGMTSRDDLCSTLGDSQARFR